MSCADATDLHDYELRELAERVAPLIDAVRRRADDALPHTAVALTGRDIQRCVGALPSTVLDDLRLSQDRMRRVVEAQRAAIRDFETEVLPGVRCGVRHVAVASAGVCLPAEPDGRSLQVGEAAVIAARAAGVERVVACVPPTSNRPGAMVVGALALAGAEEIHLVGGVRALAALTFGTESIPRVEAVIAPDGGDEALAEARRQVAAIGAGSLRPGILILADDEADPELVAADLISAHTCGRRARGVLITTSPVLGARVSGAVERQLDLLPCGHEAARTWLERGTIGLAADAEAACRLADRYGLECVELMTGDPRWYLSRLRRCQRVFVGESASAALVNQMIAPAGQLHGSGQAGSVASFLRAISYREGHAADDGAFARLQRLAGLEARARACEARVGRRLPALTTS
jgi:sulfopropanediol 3-dehydrogenase